MQQIASTIARTDGKSGWQRAYSTPMNIMLRENTNEPVVKNWAEAWELNARANKWDTSTPDQYKLKDLNASLGFTRGALAMAMRLGHNEARESIIWAERELDRVGYTLPYRWRIGPKYS